MKYLLPIALISVLITGCADTPLKEASIEDRALIAQTAKPEVTEAAGNKSESATTSGTDASNVTAKNLAADSGKPTTSVQTQGVNLQTPEAKSLSADGKTAAASGKAEGGASDHADGLKFVAQPVLDPKDPQSPLAQRRLLFDYDSSAIRDEYRYMLEMHAQFVKSDKSAKLILQGHADERGSREYNLALGQRRAESVYKALNLLGIPDSQMEAVSLGEEKPIVEGHNEEAWAQNRRTEILYQGE